MSDTPSEPNGSGSELPETSGSQAPRRQQRPRRNPNTVAKLRESASATDVATRRPESDSSSVAPSEAPAGRKGGGDEVSIVASDDSGSDANGPAGGSDGSGEGTDGEGAPKKRRRRGSRGGRNRSAASRAAAREAREGAVQSADAADAGEARESSDSNPARREQSESAPRAQSQRGQGQRSQGQTQAQAQSSQADVVAPSQAATVAGTPAQHEDRPRVGDTRPAPKPDGESDSQEGPASPARKRRRRGGRRRGSKKPVAQSAVDVDAEALELDEETLEKRRGKERNGRPLGRYLMCVQRRKDATQIAVLEGRSLIEHYVSRPNDDVSQIDGNIYLSRVQNVLPGMEAAFIDIATPKNAVLYRGDIRRNDDGADFEGRQGDSDKRIEQLLKAGQTIVTQVTKNPIGAKGARLTQEISLPGRFVVLMPNSSTYGISKRLPDDERKRLRSILDSVKPKEHGIILRTAAEGATADELRRDVARLVKQWNDIDAQVKKANAPKLVYREPDMAVRIIREEFNKNYRGVIIDDRELFEEVRDYVASISPELADRIEYFDRQAETLPLFERYHVHEQVHKALDRKVWLPSGGSLIIERTEALTVIDVNTGKNVGKSNLEETVFRNNLEAADEIARQLRLRDIGGIIVIDFIDMEIKKNRDEVLSRLRDALARDKTRTQAYPIGELGLVEMTRKRISEGLVESFSSLCPDCSGRGFVLDTALLTSD